MLQDNNDAIAMYLLNLYNETSDNLIYLSKKYNSAQNAVDIAFDNFINTVISVSKYAGTTTGDFISDIFT
jgi:hypothetical protein